MAEWPVVRLKDVVKCLDSVRRPVKASERSPGPYPYFGASGVVDHVDGWLFDGTYALVAEDGENLRTRKTPVAFLATGKFWVNNHAHILSGSEATDVRYLAYRLEASDISGYLTGSTQPKLTQNALLSMAFAWPPIAEQRAISEVLRALDEKIEANNRIMRLIGQIGRVIWRKHAAEATAAPLSQVVQVGLSGVWGKEAFSEAAPVEVLCLRGKDLEDLVDRVLPAPPRRWLSQKQVQSRLPAGAEIWTAGSGSLGPSLLVTERLQKASPQPLLYSNFVKRLVPLPGMDRHLPSAWYALLDAWEAGDFAAFTTGTAMPNLDASAMLAMVTVPLLDEAGTAQVSHWAELALDPTLLNENHNLAALRDALLRPLVSGQLRIRDAEALVGEAV